MRPQALMLGVWVAGCGAAQLARAPALETQLPKYAAHSVPLSRDSDYLRTASAGDYWALAPYYVGQRDDVSCSLATLTMVVNGARRDAPKRADEQLVTQASLFERVDSAVWRRGLAANGEGVTLDELAVLAEASMRAYAVPSRVTAIHVSEPTATSLAEFREQLRQNEANAGDWIILNFLARSYVGTGDYGHFAPVGAYDAERQRVLVLDPDREYYEPYWVPDSVAFSGMATPDSVTGRARGYLSISRVDPGK